MNQDLGNPTGLVCGSSPESGLEYVFSSFVDQLQGSFLWSENACRGKPEQAADQDVRLVITSLWLLDRDARP